MTGNFNRTLNFWPTGDVEKNWELKDLSVTESVAYEMGSALAAGTGKLIAATNATTNFIGILANEVAATDDDYATEYKLKSVWVPKSPLAEATFTVGAGTFTVADVFKSVKFNDLTGLAVDTAGIQARIMGYESSTRGVCIFNQDIV